MLPAVILAAGSSTRMGRPKATLPLPGGDTFITRIVRTFRHAGIVDVVVVTGHASETVVESLAEASLDVRVVRNAEYARGQLSSLVAGLDAVDTADVPAVLLTLVDIPLFSASTVHAVVDRYRASGPPVVRPVRGHLHGHPVVLDRRLFSQIRAARPDEGAKPVVRAHVSAEGDVEVVDEGAFVDVDTPQEYARLFGLLTRRGADL